MVTADIPLRRRSNLSRSQVAALATAGTRSGRRRSRAVRVIGACLAVALVLSVAAVAAPRQASTPAPGRPGAGTTLVGHVAGPGGVAVPGATVRLTDPRTGVRKETWTDGRGDYRLTGVAHGTYRLAITLIGLAPFERDGITVAAAPVTVNATLGFAPPPGAVGRNVPRRPGRAGGAAGRAGAGRFARPGGGRPAMQSTAGPEGAGDDAGSGAATVRFSNEADALSAAGGGGEAGEVGSAAFAGEPGGNDAAAAANAFLLSGTVGRAATPGEGFGPGRFGGGRFGGNQVAGAPGFGGGPGGVPGGRFGGPGGFGGGFLGFGGRRPQINRIRGNVFEQYSNSAFDARPYALRGPQPAQLPAYNERAGVTFGGPFRIPHLYDGSRTTFFVNANFDTSVNPVEQFATVPTAAERAGDFAGGPVIYNPATGAPFPGNTIPTTQINPAAAALLSYMPLPNLPGTVNNYYLRQTVPQQQLRLSGHVIQQLTARDSLNVNYFLQSSHAAAIDTFPGLTSQSSDRGQNLMVGETHRFGIGMFNSLQFNFNQRRTSTLNPFAYTNDLEGALGIQGVSTAPINWGLPTISFTNFAGLNLATPSLVDDRTYRVIESLVIVRGRHNLRLGGELRRVDLGSVSEPDARGTFAFTGAATSALGANGLPVAGTGLDFADFLLGLPQSTSVGFGSGTNDFRSWIANAFAQDDWRATAHLTFDYGVRYDFFQPFSEAAGHLSNLIFGPDFSSVSLVTGVNPGDLPAALIRSDDNNVSPHLALAYRPSDAHSLVLRGGYSIFYDGGLYQRLVPNLANQAPFAETARLLSTPARTLTLQNGLPASPPGVVPNTYAVDPNLRTPMAQTWSVGFEQGLPGYLLLSANYVGTKGSNLDLLLGPNRFLATGVNGSPELSLAGAEQFLYETTGASSIFNALQLDLRRQFHDGFGFNVAYTFSKSLDDASSIGGAGQTVAQNPFDLAQEWGLSVFDVRHRLVANGNYQLPFGPGRRFLSNGGPWAALLGNWQISGVATYLSGNPFTAQVLGNLAATGGVGSYFALRGNATGLPVALPADERTIQEYFNTGAFTVPLAGLLGNAGRGTIPGPPMFDVNMALDRFVTLSAERDVRLDVRLAATNVLNTVNFTSLGTVVNAITFGQVTGVAPMRALNLSLRLRF